MCLAQLPSGSWTFHGFTADRFLRNRRDLMGDEGDGALITPDHLRVTTAQQFISPCSANDSDVLPGLLQLKMPGTLDERVLVRRRLEALDIEPH
jgi:hypothetical protein